MTQTWKDGDLITADGLNEDVSTGYVVTKQPTIIDFDKMTISFQGIYHIRSGNLLYAVSEKDVTLSMENGTGFFIYYNIMDKTLNITTGSIPDNSIFLGWINITGGIQYYISTSQVLTNSENKYINPVDRQPFISTGNVMPDINTTNKTINLNVPYINGFYSGGSFSISLRGDVSIDSGADVSFVYYDTVNQKIISLTNSNTNLPYYYIQLGVIEWKNPIGNKFNFPISINGIPVNTVSSDGRKVSIASTNPLILDPDKKTLTLPADGFVILDTDNKFTSIKAANPDPIDISTSNTGAVYLFINMNTLKITAFNNKIPVPSGYLYLGWINYRPLVGNVQFKYTVSGYDSLYNGLANRKITFFGDSITWSYNPVKWYQLVTNKLRMTSTSNAIAGTLYCKTDGATNSAVERVDSITDQDIVVVWFGINDFHGERNLGTIGNGDVKTMYGAVDYVLNTLITNNPHAKIIVMTPMQQHGYSTAAGNKPDSKTPNGKGIYQVEYVNVIKEVSTSHSIPVLDMFANSGIDAFNTAQASIYLRDGLHPSQAGEYRVANKVLGFINKE